MKIFKYVLELTNSQNVEWPKGAEVLSVGLDPKGQICVWVKCDPKADVVINTVLVRGTGHDVPAEAKHLGSFVQERYVWHIFLS